MVAIYLTLFSSITAIAAVALPPSAPIGKGEKARHITATVMVQGENGVVPKQRLLARLGWRSPPVYAMTDVDGRAVLALEVPAGESEVFLSPCARTDDVLDRMAFLRDYAQKSWTRVSVPAAGDPAPVSLYVHRAVPVTARLVHQGEPARAALLVAWKPVGSDWTIKGGWFGMTKRGLAQIGGVPANAAAVAFATGTDVVARINIPPTAKAIDLGDVVIPAAPAQEAEVEITLVRTAEAPNAAIESCSEGVTMVSAADGTILTFANKGPHLRAVDNYKSETNPRVPAGRWWIAPGLFFCSEVQLKLLDLIDQKIDLEARGCTRIDAVAGAKTAIEVDAAAAGRAILGLERKP